MNLSIERAQYLLNRAQERYDDLVTGFGPSALSLAEADEELLYAQVLVEDATERPQVAESNLMS